MHEDEPQAPIPNPFPQEAERQDLDDAVLGVGAGGAEPSQGRWSKGPSIDGRVAFAARPMKPMGDIPDLGRARPVPSPQRAPLSADAGGLPDGQDRAMAPTSLRRFPVAGGRPGPVLALDGSPAAQGAGALPRPSISVSGDGRHARLLPPERLAPGTMLRLSREPENRSDRRAVSALAAQRHARPHAAHRRPGARRPARRGGSRTRHG